MIFEGSPPSLDTGAVLGFAYMSLVATALAYGSWFMAMRHLPVGQVGLIGLLNPVTGVLLGTMLASERLTLQQVVGVALVLVGI
jgi:probable blue pigment (indigoidine) exporter